MDTRTIFQKISRKMRLDFDISAEIQHAPSKGTVREGNLRRFLAEDRLPAKYGLGAGEIVGRVRETSRQCDLIVYDKPNGVTLLYDDKVQVFPIDCVYGIVEVKSALPKSEFLDALEKIKAVKVMAPGGTVSRPIGAGWNVLHARPKPFGMVFAYGLASNSLESLVENLKAWENENPPSLWPNYICVLEEGVIYHQGKPFEPCLDSDQITSESWPTATHYGQDSLFQFFCTLHDLCAHMNLGPVELRHYYNPLNRVGRFIVDGAVEFQIAKEGLGKVRFTEAALERVVNWCTAHGAMKYGDVLTKQFGSLPLGMDNTALVKVDVFLYNPGNLPGLDELGSNPTSVTEDGRPMLAPSLVSAHLVQIDGRHYVIPWSTLTEADFETVEDSKRSPD